MFGKGWLNVWAYDKYATNAISYHILDNYSHGPWKVYFVYTSNFLISSQYYSTSGGSMRLSFFGNLNYYYHEYHGIGNSFHDHDHVLVHGFGMISHLLQRMVQIQLDGIGDFS